MFSFQNKKKMIDFKICQTCLAFNVKMYCISEEALKTYHGLFHTFKIMSMEESSIFGNLCFECLAILNRLRSFHAKCLNARKVLDELSRSIDRVSESEIIDARLTYRLQSNLKVSLTNQEEQKSYDATETEYDVIKKDEDVFAENNLTEIFLTNELKASDEIVEFDISAIKCEEEEFDAIYHSPAPSEDDDNIPLVYTKKRNKSGVTKKKRKYEKVKDENEKKIKIKKVHKRKEGDGIESKGLRSNFGMRLKEFNEDYATEIILSREQQMDEMKARIASSNYTNSPMKCQFCYRGFLDEIAYNNHMRKHDESYGPCGCEVCGLRFPTEARVRKHAMVAHMRRYECRWCGHKSHSMSKAKEHENWHQGATYQCQVCGETFRKQTTHLSHMRLAHPSNFVCTLCGDSFLGEKGLRAHKFKSHKGDTDASDGTVKQEDAERPDTYCPECELTFSTEEAFRKHFVTSSRHAVSNDFRSGCRICGEKFPNRSLHYQHTKQHGVTPHRQRMNKVAKSINYRLVCELCGKTCRTYAQLKTHGRTHTGEKRFECKLCTKKLTSKQQLLIHTRIHTGEKPYSCETCGKAFKEMQKLKSHIDVVHKGIRPYACTQCDKSFSSMYNQRMHVNTVHLKMPAPYTGRKKRDKEENRQREKRFECKFCSKRVTSKQQLIIHTRIHTRELPYSCELCGKCFKDLQKLKSHIDVIHKGIRPFVCPHCQKPFSSQYNRRLHVNTVHLKLPAPYCKKKKVDRDANSVLSVASAGQNYF